MKAIILIVTLVFVSGCLKTRSELQGNSNGEGAMRTDASGTYVGGGNLPPQQRAQIDSRFFEIDRDFRQLYGKIEVLEQKVADTKEAPATGAQPMGEEAQKKIEALEKRVSTLEEALLAIDKKMGQMAKKKSAKNVRQQLKGVKGFFDRGEIYFKNGKYEEAIAEFNKYRTRYPKGRKYGRATLKIGQAFQRLKMNKDAKAFYNEVIQRYPNTKVASTAQANLKKL